MNQENLRNDLDHGIDKFTLIGDRILVLLDEAKGHTITESGIEIPLNDVVATDSGRATTETSNHKHLNRGVVLLVGALAAKKLEEQEFTIKPGDKVYVNPSAQQKNFYFFPSREVLVQDFKGYVCIPNTLIEAKIND